VTRSSKQLHQKWDTEKHRITEETFKRAFEYAAFGMALIGVDGCFLQVNQSACNMFGYPADELITKTFQELTHPDDLEKGVDLFQDILNGTREFGWLEKRYIRKDGKVIWALLSTSAVRNSQKDILYLVSQIQDITERKIAETNLVEKEAQYRSTFEASQDGLIVNKFNGTIVDVNPAFCEMHGYDYDELIGRHPAIFIHPDDHSLFDEYLQTVQKGEVFLGRAVDIHRNGTSFHVEVHGAPFSYKGTPHVLGVVRDVTEQVQAQQILENEVETRTKELAALYDVANVASTSLDLNEVMERSLDSVLKAMNCDMGAIHLVSETKREITLSSWRNVPEEILEEIEILPFNKSLPGRILDQGKPLIVPDMLRDPDTVPAAKRILGKKVYLGVPMKAKGKTVGVLVIIGQADRVFAQEEMSLLSSIAQQIGVAVENARLHKQTEVLVVTEERQRLAREIHDTLAQGLTGIKLQLDAVESALEMEENESALQRLSVARKLADQSLVEARRSVWAIQSKSLEDKNICDALIDSIRDLTFGTELEVALDLQDDLPRLATEVKTDLLRVAQEAVMNVVKHAQAKHLTVNLTYRNNKIQLKVLDDGQGILPSRYREEGGDVGGFGLFAMKERVERHGGTLQIDSHPKSGTSVVVTIEFKNSGV
jgi:PAS domain S-box-containing protein